MKKNVFITFCCACVPGFGQMYLGYMKRGVSLAAWFWGVIALATLLNLGVLSFILPVIWAYAFFDTFNIYNLSPEQRAVFADEYLPSAEWLQKNGFTTGFVSGRGGKIAGWLLVGAGIYMLYINLVEPILWELGNYFDVAFGLISAIPTALVAIAVIALGMWMLGKNKNSSAAHNGNTDDTTPFKGE